MPVTIRNVSCDGMALALADGDAPAIGVGSTVTMRMQMGTLKVELPARVVWYQPHRPLVRYDIGVHLELEIARASVRHQWAEWVVALTRTHKG